MRGNSGRNGQNLSGHSRHLFRPGKSRLDGFFRQHREKRSAGVLLHSDQGHQYRSHAYYVLTQQAQLIPSMSRRGNCWDNAPMENFFSHPKEESLRHYPQPTFAEAQKLIDEYIRFYNYERIQLKTKLTPYECRCQSG
jgi:putative transposase